MIAETVSRLKRKIILWAFAGIVAWGAYYVTWGRYLYTVTAYCDCPICINVKSYQDSLFASGKPVYWGGVAADPSVPFGADIELLPHSPLDWLAVMAILHGRRGFTVEDRGGKIKGRHIDLFISDDLGGHEMAKQWGVRKMRLRINGALAK